MSFSCQDLIDLDIYRCVLKPPPTFKAFRSLKNLRFEKVTLAQDVFENLIAYSPLLERLTLQNCDSLTHLKIDAPNLQFLVVIGAFEDVNFENTLNLRVVNLSVQVGQRIVSAGNLVKCFVQLPHIRSLTMDFSFLQYLALERALPEKLPNPCLLKYLSISINCSDLKEILTVLCLLRSSPALEELEILAHQEDQVVGGEVNSWFDDNQNCPLTKLRYVEIISISDVKAELDFIKFLLSNSPVLRKMTVKPASAKGEIVTNLLQFRRASALAEIIYLNP